MLLHDLLITMSGMSHVEICTGDCIEFNAKLFDISYYDIKAYLGRNVVSVNEVKDNVFRIII